MWTDCRTQKQIIQLSEVIAMLEVIGVNEVIDDTTVRDVNDFLS